MGAGFARFQNQSASPPEGEPLGAPLEWKRWVWLAAGLRRMGASRACRWPGKRKGDRANAEIASAMVGASRGCERSPGGWGQPARRAEPAVRSAVGRKTRRCSPTVLNAEVLLPAFKGARQSDRHFVTHVWTKVPMPRFEPSNPLAQETGVAWRARGARRDACVRSGHHPCQGQSRGKEGDSPTTGRLAV